MAKLLGMQVKTPGVERFHTVWAGQTEEKREDHKTFILENCAPRNEDGTPNCYFVDVEADILVTGPGMYQTNRQGQLFYVEKLSPDGVRCYGYTQKLTRGGKLRNDQVRWYYISGEGCAVHYPRLTSADYPYPKSAGVQPVAP